MVFSYCPPAGRRRPPISGRSKRGATQDAESTQAGAPRRLLQHGGYIRHEFRRPVRLFGYRRRKRRERRHTSQHNTEYNPVNEFALSANGIRATSERSSAAAVNEATGYVQTVGPRSFGVFTRTANDGAEAIATAAIVNRGLVATRGRNTDGVVVLASHGGSEVNPNSVVATNFENGIVGTQGDMASGIIAGVDVLDRRTSFGSVRAENAGSISTSGGRGDGTAST